MANPLDQISAVERAKLRLLAMCAVSHVGVSTQEKMDRADFLVSWAMGSSGQTGAAQDREDLRPSDGGARPAA